MKAYLDHPYLAPAPLACVCEGGQLHIPLFGISLARALACWWWRAARVQERIHECIAFALTGMHSPASLLPACRQQATQCLLPAKLVAALRVAKLQNCLSAVLHLCHPQNLQQMHCRSLPENC